MKIGFHKGISFVKSALRILSSIVALIALYTGKIILIPVHLGPNAALFFAIVVLAFGYGLAEILGVVEEVFENN